MEYCAHTMGATWEGVPSGRHGVVGCYSMQTYKHMNSGEGGFLISDDAEVMARAVLLSGSYMLYGKHLAAPARGVRSGADGDAQCFSGRMAICGRRSCGRNWRCWRTGSARWEARYRALEAGLRDVAGLRLIARPDQERFSGLVVKFLLPGWSQARIGLFLTRTLARGVELKWFGAVPVGGFHQPVSALGLRRGPKPAADRPHLGGADRHAGALDLFGRRLRANCKDHPGRGAGGGAGTGARGHKRAGSAVRAAWIYAALTAVVCTFHLAVILGAPLGHLTMGGRWEGALPVEGRIGSALSMLLLAAMAKIECCWRARSSAVARCRVGRSGAWWRCWVCRWSCTC